MQSSVASVRAISLQTVSQLVSSAGSLLKPSLPVLIPALLNSIGEVAENKDIMYIRNATANSSEAQELIDNVTAQTTKNHFSTDTMTKVH